MDVGPGGSDRGSDPDGNKGETLLLDGGNDSHLACRRSDGWHSAASGDHNNVAAPLLLPPSMQQVKGQEMLVVYACNDQGPQIVESLSGGESSTHVSSNHD